jgi:hypothetical protein
MELKAALKDYTEPEFQTLVNRIWAVDMPKRGHDQLINHFDRIVGHPEGADLLFYSKDEYNPNSPEGVVGHVKEWWQQHGVPAFKGQSALVSAPMPYVPLNPAQMAQQRALLSLAGVQRIVTELAASEQVIETALGLLEQRIKHLHDQQVDEVKTIEREASLRALEVAEYEARKAAHQYGYWKSSVEFTKSAALRDMTDARSEQAQWQSIAQQISATHERYAGHLIAINQRLLRLQVQAEALLVLAQAQLVRQRHKEGVGPTQAPGLLVACLAFAKVRPSILLNGALSQPLETHWVALQKSIRSAMAEFTWQLTNEAETHTGVYAAILRFEFVSRAETEMYGLSVPLAELHPMEGQDWQGLAKSQAGIDMRFRMNSGSDSVPPGTLSRGLKQIQTLLQIALRPTNGTKVPVREAIWDDRLNAFCFSTDAAVPVAVRWVSPGVSDTPAGLVPATASKLGFLLSAPVPVLDVIDDIETVQFDDYVVVFPSNSGLDPLYVMFRDKREYPEIAIAEITP